MGSFLRPKIWREDMVQPRPSMGVLLTKAFEQPIALSRCISGADPFSEALTMSGQLR
jgi:hypothetical protein